MRLLALISGLSPRVLPAAIVAKDTAVFSALLTFVTGLVFAPYVRDGGFTSDDWALAALYRFAQPPRYLDAVHAMLSTLGARPMLAIAQPIPHAVFGDRLALHLIAGLALSGLVSIALFALLRTLAMMRIDAGAIALLAALLPWADAARLWPTASSNTLSITFFLCGAIAGIRGFLATGPRRTILRCTCLGLYVLSLMTYELAGLAIVLTGLVYFLLGPRDQARRWWLTEVCVGIAILAVAATQTVLHVSPLNALSRVPVFAYEATVLTSRAIVPFGSLAGMALFVFGIAALWRLRRGLDAGMAAALRPWIVMGSIAVLGVAVGYAVFLPSGLFPLDPATGNRVNVLAALPISILVYCAWRTIGVLAVSPWPRLAGYAPLIAAIGLLAVGLAYASQTREHARDWARAADSASRILTVIKQTVEHPRRDATIYTFGAPGESAPGVPIFGQHWDLSSAVKLLYDAPDLRAFPIFGNVRIVCGKRRLHPSAADSYGGLVLEGGYGPAEGSRYGAAVFVDVAARRAHPIRGRAECLRRTRTLAPGPAFGVVSR